MLLIDTEIITMSLGRFINNSGYESNFEN